MSAELQNETMPTADELCLSACETIPQRTAADTEVREDSKVAERVEYHRRESTPSTTVTELAPEPTAMSAPPKKEDARLAELRLLGESFQARAEKTCDCPIMISGETMRSFESTIRGSIQLIREQDEYIKELERINQHLQDQFEKMHRDSHQEAASYLQMQRRMQFLECNNKYLRVKCDELEKCTTENEIARTIFQSENRNLFEVAPATEERDPAVMTDLRVNDTVAVKFETDVHETKAETGHETKPSEDGPSRKRSRLN